MEYSVGKKNKIKKERKLKGKEQKIENEEVQERRQICCGKEDC